MKPDQAEQLDVLLSQSMKVVNKNWDTEKTEASMTSKWDNTSPFAFDDRDTQTEIVMADKKDTELVSSKQQLPMPRVNKSIMALQKAALTSSDTPKEQLAK